MNENMTVKFIDSRIYLPPINDLTVLCNAITFFPMKEEYFCEEYELAKNRNIEFNTDIHRHECGINVEFSTLMTSKLLYTTNLKFNPIRFGSIWPINCCKTMAFKNIENKTKNGGLRDVLEEILKHVEEKNQWWDLQDLKVWIFLPADW